MKHDNANNGIFAFNFCPVPIKQLPVKKYQSLKESNFFRWAFLDNLKYITKLLAVWISGLLLAALVASSKSTYNDVNFLCILKFAIAGKIVALLCCIKLYTAWYSVKSHLISQKVVYQIIDERKICVWYKSNLMLIRDRLIAEFQVRPILKRIKRTIFLISLFLSLNFMLVLKM